MAWCRPWRVLLVDQRNHGKSGHLPGFDPPHTLGASAADIAHLLQDVLGERPLHAMLGHSLGGKVALSYLQRAEQLQESQTPMLLPRQVSTGSNGLAMQIISSHMCSSSPCISHGTTFHGGQGSARMSLHSCKHSRAKLQF